MPTQPLAALVGESERPRLRSVGRWLALAALVGIVAGLGAAAFSLISQAVGFIGLEYFAGYEQGGPAHEHDIIQAIFGVEGRDLLPWMLVVVPTVGGLVSGWLVYTFAPEAEGHGTDSAIDAYHNKRGMIRARVPLVKILASAVTLGTGGSGGREGPIAQIGAGFGSFLATRMRLSDSERRVLLSAGIGAGIGAIFHAPLAGAIFAIEVLYRDPDFEAEALIPAFIATTVAYCVFGLTMGLGFGFDTFRPLFAVTPGLRFDNPALLLPLAALALAMAGTSLVYCRSFYGAEKAFGRLGIPRVLKPAVGAMLTGALAVAIYYGAGGMGLFTGLAADAQRDTLDVLSYGYGFLQKVLHPDNGLSMPMALLLIVGLGKIITTSLTIGSGGSGGVFGPSMVIGGSLGAVVGLIFHHWTPNVVGSEDVVVFAILGMAGFFAAAANTPVSTLIMVSELTGSYTLLLPSMWVCALAYVVSRRWTIYAKQVANRIESPAHRGDFIIDILEGMTVRDTLTDTARQFITVPLEMPLREVMQMITNTRQSSFPVLDDDGRYVGLFSLNDIRQFLYHSNLGDLAVAQDLADEEIRPLLATTDLGEAIGRFSRSRFEELPVAETDDPDRAVAMVRRVDMIAAYNARLLETRDEQSA